MHSKYTSDYYFMPVKKSSSLTYFNQTVYFNKRELNATCQVTCYARKWAFNWISIKRSKFEVNFFFLPIECYSLKYAPHVTYNFFANDAMQFQNNRFEMFLQFVCSCIFYSSDEHVFAMYTVSVMYLFKNSVSIPIATIVLLPLKLTHYVCSWNRQGEKSRELNNNS